MNARARIVRLERTAQRNKAREIQGRETLWFFLGNSPEAKAARAAGIKVLSFDFNQAPDPLGYSGQTKDEGVKGNEDEGLASRSGR